MSLTGISLPSRSIRHSRIFTVTCCIFTHTQKAMYEQDTCMEGFEWVNADDSSRSIYSFIRHSKGAKRTFYSYVTSHRSNDRSTVSVYRAGKQYRLVLNSDELQYGGSGKARPAVYKAKKQECDGRPYSFGLRSSAIRCCCIRILT